MTDSHTVEVHYLVDSDSELSPEESAQPLFASKINSMYTKWNSFWQTDEQKEEADTTEQAEPRRRSTRIGPMSKEEWQEIMAEANKKIRSLQFTAMEQKQHLNEYMKQIDQLVEEQARLRLTHKTELSMVENEKDHQRVSMLQQIQKLHNLRDEMTEKFQLTERKANLLLQEKIELESELTNMRRRSTATTSHDIGIGPDEAFQAPQTNNNKDVSYWKQKALAFEAAVKDLTAKYDREYKQRRKLYNQLQELKGNIRVFARCRPLLTHEQRQNARNVADFPDEETICVANTGGAGKSETFRFDSVFGPDCNNEQVYEQTAPYIQSVMDGYNVTIFAYGQTGSGKTFTMSSVNHCALQDLFRLQNENKSQWIHETFVSMLEIYNENIMDLLDKKSNGKEYKIRFKAGDKKQKQEIYVEGLKKVQVNGLEEVEQLMAFGASNRSVAHTKMNAESSRSHSLLVVYVTAENKTTNMKISGKLNLIDLAGSERVKKSGVDGMAMKEAQNINKSLSALGDVIEALWKKQKHIPYRNSKLTFILQDSLGKSAKTLMFINVSPADIHFQETLTSLRFAQRAKNVELGVANKNVVAAAV